MYLSMGRLPSMYQIQQLAGILLADDADTIIRQFRAY